MMDYRSGYQAVKERRRITSCNARLPHAWIFNDAAFAESRSVNSTAVSEFSNTPALGCAMRVITGIRSGEIKRRRTIIAGR